MPSSLMVTVMAFGQCYRCGYVGMPGPMHPHEVFTPAIGIVCPMCKQHGFGLNGNVEFWIGSPRQPWMRSYV